MKKVAPRRSTMPFWTVTFACSLLILFGGCSWVRMLQDNFKPSGKGAQTPATALPTLEVSVRMLYPNRTRTVEGAISYMLEPHSYRPAIRNTDGDVIAERTFINNFNNDPVPLHVALERLMGRDGQVILDRQRKLYAFRTREPHEPGIVFADLTTAAGAQTRSNPTTGTDFKSVPFPRSAPPGNEPARDAGAPPEQTGRLARDPAQDRLPVNMAALRAGDNEPGRPEVEEIPAQNREFCHAIQFRNQSMLSATVQEYFLGCGFDEVSWKLGKPGRYADYRLLENIDLPLPERHRDLIEFLQSRFGIKTFIHDNNRVEFYDEENLL